MAETPKPKQFDALDPSTKAFALVGRFFQDWAVVESGMNGAIGKALKLNPDPQAIVTANLGVAQKINVLHSIVTHDPWLGAKQDHFTKVISKISKLSETRNIIAHNFFCMNDNGTEIVFSQTKAKRGLEYVKHPITVEKFHEYNETLYKLAIELSQLEEEIRKNMTDVALSKIVTATGTGSGTSSVLGFSSDTPLALRMSALEK